MYYLAIDIGTKSGRHLLGHVKDGRLVHEEIHRFSNGVIKQNGYLCWDTSTLFNEILTGMKKCKEINKIPVSVGIDTWGVDFILLDRNFEMLGQSVSFRDSRADGMEEEVEKLISAKELYFRTGVLNNAINTINQLMAVKMHTNLFSNTRQMLMIADYFHYLLCGKAVTEYTIATTTGLVSAISRNWDGHVIKACDFPRDMFTEIATPGTTLGYLLPSISKQVGFDCKVVLPASHDMASAVVSAAANAGIYLSSGSWSFMGTEVSSPFCMETSRLKGFTNEGGYAYRYRYARKIIGLKMIEDVIKEMDCDDLTFSKLAEETTFTSIIDPTNPRFFNPQSMVNEIQNACKETGQPIPKTPGEMAAVIYNSLADAYKEIIYQLEMATGLRYADICVVGGGAKSDYLNRLTEKVTGKIVKKGSVDSAAIGNLAVQMLADGVFADLAQARESLQSI